jgi:MFS family permease
MVTVTPHYPSHGRHRALRTVQPVLKFQLELFPSLAHNRWVVRALFALPFVLLSVLESMSTGLDNGTTANEDLVARVATIDWTHTEVGAIADLYPPISTISASVIPGGTLGLAIAGSLLAGYFLQKLLETMHQRRFRAVKAIIFVIAVAGNPLFAFTITENFESTVGIVFFGLAMANALQFIVYRNTQAGFRAGIQLMVTALSSVSGILYVAVAALTTPLLTLSRRGQRGARWSNVFVILFPTVASFAAVVFLQIVFLHSASRLLANSIDVDPTRLAIIPHLFTTLDGALILAPLVSGWALALIAKRPGAIPISTVVFAALVFGYIIGVIPENSAGNIFLIMTIIGVATLPRGNSTHSTVLTSLVAAVQIAIAWFAAYNRPITLDWIESIERMLGW